MTADNSSYLEIINAGIPRGQIRHALFDFEGMSADIEWSRTWYRDGEERVAKTQNWTGDERGTWGLRYYNTDGNPLKSGNYELQLTIGGNLVQSGTFVIQP